MSRALAPFQPLRVKFVMGSPIDSTGYGLHLDSILAFIAVHVAGYFNQNTPIGWEPSETASLPLAKMHYGDKWWYRASASLYSAEVCSKQFLTKRFDKDHLDLLNLGKATKVTTAGGPWRERYAPIEAVFVPEVDFYCVGSYRKIKDLVRRVRHIGPKGKHGYGVVRDYNVEKLEVPVEGFTLDWRREDNTPARNLPVGFCIESGLTLISSKRAPVQPPYWRVTEPNVCEVGV